MDLSCLDDDADGPVGDPPRRGARRGRRPHPTSRVRAWSLRSPLDGLGSASARSRSRSLERQSDGLSLHRRLGSTCDSAAFSAAGCSAFIARARGNTRRARERSLAARADRSATAAGARRPSARPPRYGAGAAGASSVRAALPTGGWRRSQPLQRAAPPGRELRQSSRACVPPLTPVATATPAALASAHRHAVATSI